MKEKEVIQYLKSNIRTGISFHFMPKEVQNWIMKNYKDCAYLNDDGIWDRATKYVSDINDIWASDVYALIEGYEPKPKEPKAEWVEFEIDNEGSFSFRFGREELGNYTDQKYFWFEWESFLKDCLLDRVGFTAFGGWQYAACDIWFMYPQIFSERDAVYHGICEDNDNPRPAIPKKIRFWRGK